MSYGRFIDTRKFGTPDAKAPGFPAFQFAVQGRAKRQDSVPLPTGFNPIITPSYITQGDTSNVNITPPIVPAFGQQLPPVAPDNNLTLDQQAFLAALMAEVFKQYEPLRYFDMVSQPVNLTTTDSLVLPGSDTKRCMLIILNNDPANIVLFSFGIVASVNTALPLAPGTGFVFDAAVPQNDLHMVSNAAPTSALLMYGNKVLA